MRVRDIMTERVVTGSPELTLTAAARKMREGSFGTLPIVDKNGRLVGMLTDRDICMTVATRNRGPAHISIREGMTTHVRTCRADDELEVALGTMREARVRRLPVVDAEGRLQGILSIDDIILRAADRPEGLSAAHLLAALQKICERRERETAIES